MKLFQNVRGITDEQFLSLKNASCSYPFTMFKDENIFLTKLNQSKNTKILVIPDYDVDGIMSGVIAHSALSEFGFDVNLYYPSSSFGYGLTRASLEHALSIFPDTKTIITCDNGIAAFDGIAFAKSKGITVLVSDHHPQGSMLPQADVVVDPSRVDDEYPFPGICGAQVIYHLMLSYAAAYHPDKYTLIQNLGVFAGIAAVGDSMPMLEENRALVRASLSYFDSLPDISFDFLKNTTSAYSDAFTGLYNIYNVICNAGKYTALDEDTYAFYLCPMLNAPRRVMGESKLSFENFTNRNTDSNISNKLFDINEFRKDVTQKVFSELCEELATIKPVYFRTTPIIRGGGGYAGLIAGKLTSKTGLPSICFSYPDSEIELADSSACDDIIKESVILSGSGRAPAWYNLPDFLARYREQHPDADFSYGGHAQACGLSINSKYLPDFSLMFTLDAERAYADYISSFPDEYVRDSDFSFSLGLSAEDSIEISDPQDTFELLNFVTELTTLKPFGVGFPKPTFKFTLDLKQFYIQNIGSGKHVKASFKRTPIDFLFWNSREIFDKKTSPRLLVFGDLSVNTFRGQNTLTVKAEDFTFL